MKQVKIGDVVQYRTVRDIGGKKYENDFPAMVYAVYRGNYDEEGIPIGLSVLFDGVPTRYGRIYYSEVPKADHWSLIPEEAEGYE